MPTPWVDTLSITDPFTGWTPAEFSQEFFRLYGDYPEFYAAGGFASGIILMDAIEKTQSLDTDTITSYIRHGKISTIYGNVSFHEDNMYAGEFLIVQVANGGHSYDMVLPTPAPNVSLLYPAPTWTQKSCIFETDNCNSHGACSAEGTCVCSGNYYGDVCELYCNGELDIDAVGDTFCKVNTQYYIGGIATLGRGSSDELAAVITLAFELVNNNTDGFLDDAVTQVFVRNHLVSIECNEEDATSAVDELTAWAESYDSILHGIVGPFCSTASETISSQVDTTIISYGSTAVEFSDKNDFPRFSRTCLSDDVQGACLSDMLYKLRLYNIAIISTNDRYSTSLSGALTSNYLKGNGTILAHVSYEASSGSNETFYDSIIHGLSSSGAPAIVLVTTEEEAILLLEARLRHPVMSSDQYMWIGVDEWVGSSIVDAPRGTIGLVPQPLETAYSFGTDFMNLWAQLDPDQYPDEDGDRTTLSSYSGYAVDAVFGMALAHQAVIDSNFDGAVSDLDQEVYLELVNSVSFIGVTGNVDFDAGGDRLFAQYNILNKDNAEEDWIDVGYTEQSDTSYVAVLDLSTMVWPDGSVGSNPNQDYSKQYIPYCPPGYEPVSSSSTNIISCEACAVGTYKPEYGSELCEACPEGSDCSDIAITVPCILPGYWRPEPPEGQEGDFDKYEIFKCDRDKNCLGGCALNSTCGYNHEQSSPVCGVCKDGYYKSSFEDCSACPSDVSFLDAMEILFVFGAVTVLFVLLFVLYSMHICECHNIPLSFFLFSYCGYKIETDTGSLSGQSVSDRATNIRGTTWNLRVTSTRISAMVNQMKTSGLFVTVKLVISFVQVLSGKLLLTKQFHKLSFILFHDSGSLHQIDVQWSSSMHNMISSFQYDPFRMVPLFSGCREHSLEAVYVTALLVLTLPILFGLFAFGVSQLVLYRAQRVNFLTIKNRKQMSLSARDILLKSFVWFCLLSFPSLSSRYVR